MSRLFSSKMNFRQCTHVIFDMDGLLLDTENLYTQVTQNILDPYGKTYTWDVKSTLMGLQRDEVAKMIVEIYELPITWQEYVDAAIIQQDILMKTAELLPDTEKIYEGMVRDVAKSFNKEYDFVTRMKIMGTTEHRTAEIAVKDLNLPITVDEFKKTVQAMGAQRLQNVPLFRGAEKLIRFLHAEKIPFCLATSSGSDMVDVKTGNHKELFSLFGHKVMGSTDPDVKMGKPAPDIFLVAASRFPDKPKPENCLVFEDAPNGVSAARSAGMQVVMVPDEKCPEDARKNATLVLNSLEEIKLEDFGLPAIKF